MKQVAVVGVLVAALAIPAALLAAQATGPAAGTSLGNVTLTTRVMADGQPLAAGTYSLWTEPNPGRWTFIFSRAHPVYHTPYPEGQDALRVPVTPRTGQHMETMAFYFPIVEGKQAELALHWGVVIVPLVLEVP